MVLCPISVTITTLKNKSIQCENRKENSKIKRNENWYCNRATMTLENVCVYKRLRRERTLVEKKYHCSHSAIEFDWI